MSPSKKNRPAQTRSSDALQNLQFETLEPKVMLTGSPSDTPPTVLDSSAYVAEFDSSHLQEKFVRNYLANHSETAFLQQGNSDLRLVEIKYGLAGVYTKFVQTMDGYEIFGANITVNQGADGTVQQLFNDGHDKLNLGSIPTNPIVFNAAESLALEHAGGSETFAQSKGNWAWFVDEQGNAVAGWKMTVSAVDPLGDYLTFIDGTNGDVLFQENRTAFATGTGDVFNPNPYQTLGSGNGLNDNSDADSAALTGQLENVTLLGLDNGTGLLIGEFVDLATLNSGSLPDVDANEADRNYNYTRNDARFEQVNIYHSVDSINRYFHALGFDDDSGVANGIRDFPTLANAHWYTQDQSFYSTGDDAIHFGDGGVDDGEDGDIIAHEYGHAIQHNQNSSWGGGDMGAMGEGFGDYLAASFYFGDGDATFQASNAACVGEWDATSYSSTDPPCLRRVDGNKTYNDIGGGVHADGEIWSASLWDIRAAIGAATIDQLVLESHFGLPGGATMPVAAEGILLADQNLNGGANQNAIRQVFVDRLILEPLPNAGTIALNSASYNQDDTITVTVVDGNASGAVTVDFVSTSGDTETLTLADIGSNTYQATIDTASGSANGGDGQLQVSIGDTVTATYTDADDGTGSSNDVTDSADIANVVKYNATGLPITIEAGPHLSTIDITDSGTLADLDVFINIDHTYAADLDVFLIAPDGTRIELFSDVGGGGNNFVDTTLDDSADTAIADGSAPFTGSFRPEGNLADLQDIEIAGTWTLEITDDFPFDVDSGNLNAWSLCMAVTPEFNPVDIDLAGPAAALNEGDVGTTTDAVFQIVLAEASGQVVTVDYTTSTAGLANPALAGVDFVAVTGTATFQPGQTTFDVAVPVIGDHLAEVTEQFNLVLSNETGGTIVNAMAVATINDDEVFSLNQGIDFGTQGSAVADGFIGISTKLYSADAGFGWLPGTTSVQTVERSSGTAISGDIALVDGGQFGIDLTKGTYRVVVWIGDTDAGYSDIELNVEGVTDNISTVAGNFEIRSYQVFVNDGQITLELDGVGADTEVPIAAIQIFKANEYRFDFGPVVDADLAAGFQLGTDAVFTDKAGYGWRNSNISAESTSGTDSLTRDYVVTERNLFVANVERDIYEVTVNLGHPTIAQDNVQFFAAGKLLDTISVDAGETFTETYLVKVNRAPIELQFVNATGSQPNLYLNSLEIMPASSNFNGGDGDDDSGRNSRTVFDAGSFAGRLNGQEFQSSARASLSNDLLSSPQTLNEFAESSQAVTTARPIIGTPNELATESRREAKILVYESHKAFDAAFDDWNKSLEQWF